MEIFDFEYVTPEGEHVFVEVKYSFVLPDASTDASDWDYYGGFDIQEVAVYNSNAKVVDVFISEDIIKKSLVNYFEEMQLASVIEDNQYY